MANVSSAKGSIDFDRDFDGQAEMSLNQQGLQIGTGEQHSGLQINATLGYQFLTPSSNLDLNSTDHQASLIFANTASENITINLPYAGNVKGRVYTIKKTSSHNHLWITGGGNYMDEQLVYEMNENLNNDLPEITFASDGAQWFTLFKHSDLSHLASDNLIMWNKLDETTGSSVSDHSRAGDNHDGQLIGTTFSENTITSKIHRGLYLDGSDDYVDLPDSNSLDLSQNITISVWFKVDNFINTYPTVFAKNSQNYRLYLIQSNQKGQVRLNGIASVNTTTKFNADEWYHFVFTYNGMDKKIFINGQLDAHEVEAGSINTNNDDFVLGNMDEGSNRGFNGTIDDFRVYNKDLTSDQILALYQANLNL